MWGYQYEWVSEEERRQLYHDVWKEPMRDLAKRYGKSDVALRKECKKLEIPLPPQGFWAKKDRKGYKIPPLLPISDRAKLLRRKFFQNDGEKEVEKQIESIRTDKPLPEPISVEVKSQLRNPHPLVEEARDNLKTKKGDNQWPRIYTEYEMIDISVSKPQVERVLRIFDALIKHIEQMGFSIKIKKRKQTGYREENKATWVCIGKEQVQIRITEDVNRKEHILTPEEIERNKKSYAYYPQYDFIPSGCLVLQIDWYWAKRKNWRDGKTRKVEDLLGEFIAALIETAELMRIRDEIAKKENQLRMAEERKREELKQRHEKETERFKALEKAANDWQRSQAISRFVAAVSVAGDESAKRLGEIFDVDDWIKWANGKVEWLNPLTKKKDPILGRRK